MNTLPEEQDAEGVHLEGMEEGAAAVDRAIDSTAGAVEEVDRITAWRANLAVLVATIGCFAPLYSVQALYPAVEERFGLGVNFAAALLTICTVGLAVFSPVAGRFSAGWGIRSAVKWSLIGLIATNVAIGLCRDASLLLGLRLLQGFLIPLGLAALLASLGSVWRESGAVGLGAVYTTGVICGGLVGRFLPAGLASFGWSAAFFGFAAFQAVLLFGTLKLFPSTSSSSAVSLEQPLGTWLLSVAKVVRHQIPAVAIGGFVLMAAQVATTTYIAIRLSMPPFGWSQLALGALYIVFLPAIGVVRFIPPALERYGWKQIFLLTALALNGSLVLTLFDLEWLILVGLVGFSASVFAAQTIFAQALSSTHEADRERASSGYLACYYAGASAGAFVPALAWHEWGWSGCVGVVITMQFTGLILASLSSGGSRSEAT